MIKTLAILGPGLLGGSLALAARERGLADTIRVWARSQSRAEQVRQSEAGVEAGTDLDEIAADADLVVLATPVGVMPDLAAKIASSNRLAAGAVVTDVGSVKGLVDEKVRPLLEAAGIAFVGSHPMAGSELTGWENADAGLFEGAVCVVTPAGGPNAAAGQRVEALWKSLGCDLFRMTPAEHDASVARISHFPHVAAAALVLAALEGHPDAAGLSGNGFRDTTRVASGAPGMWTEILLENRDEVVSALQRMEGKISEVLEFLADMDKENLRRFLENAQELRDASLPRQ